MPYIRLKQNLLPKIILKQNVLRRRGDPPPIQATQCKHSVKHSVKYSVRHSVKHSVKQCKIQCIFKVIYTSFCTLFRYHFDCILCISNAALDLTIFRRLRALVWPRLHVQSNRKTETTNSFLILFCSVWVFVLSQPAEIRSRFSTDAFSTSSPLPMSYKISFCFAK